MEITFMLYKSNGLTHYQYRLGSSYEYKSKTNLQTKMMVKGNISFFFKLSNTFNVQIST